MLWHWSSALVKLCYFSIIAYIQYKKRNVIAEEQYGSQMDDFVRNFDIKEKLHQPPVSLKQKRTRMECFLHVKIMGQEIQVKNYNDSWDRKKKTGEEVTNKIEGRAPKRSWEQWTDSQAAAEEAQDRETCEKIVLASCNYSAAGSWVK